MKKRYYTTRFTQNPHRGELNKNKSLTVPDEAYTIQELVARHKMGNLLPTARTLDVPAIGSIIDRHFDLPDLEKYHQMDMVEQAYLRNEITGIKNMLKSAIDDRLSSFQQKNSALPEKPDSTESE